MSDKYNLGLYGKFIVQRTDGTDKPGRKHAHCEYFVLDLTHDPFAMPALVAYRNACRRKFPKLARDLTKAIRAARASAPDRAPENANG